MSKILSGEEAQELCDEYCENCRYYRWFDDGAAECTKSWNVVYVPEEECCDCCDFEPISCPEPQEGYLGLYDHKIDGEWY